jgi:hypothetical protein
VSRFPTRTAAALLLAALNVAPIVYRAVERERQLASFQGEWRLWVCGAAGPPLVPDPADRRLWIEGDKIRDTRRVVGHKDQPPPHYKIGEIADGSVELTLVYNDGRTAGPWHGQYKLDGDTLTIRIVDRSFLWWDYPYEMALYGGGLNLRSVTAVACGR